MTVRCCSIYPWQFRFLRICNIVEVTFLRGQTSYGDSIEDEWLIVYLLRELSKQFSSLWIKVVDSDGEFLLVEAANALPRWLNPEIADNRVNLCLMNPAYQKLIRLTFYIGLAPQWQTCYHPPSTCSSRR